MLSGIRGTNFINTNLNVAYFRNAMRHVYRLFGLKPRQLHNEHSGDDVFIANRMRLWAIATYTTMQSIGYDFSDIKQLFDIGRAEFLRVMYTVEGVIGYIARAIASLILKPIQTMAKWGQIKTAPIPSMMLGSRELEANIPNNMSKAWIKIMSERIKRSFMTDGILEELHKSNISDSLRAEDRSHCLSRYLYC